MNKLSPRLFFLLAAFFSISAHAEIFTTPLEANSIIQISHLDYSDGDADEPLGYFATSTASSFSDTYISTAQSHVASYGNLANGKVGSIAKGTTGTDYQTSVAMYDTLQFTTPNDQATQISFNLSFDGILSSYLKGQADAHYTVRIYDITETEHWLEDRRYVGSVYPSFASYVDVNVSGAATRIFSESIHFGMNPSNDSKQYNDLNFFGATNAPTLASLTKQGSITVDPSRGYGIEIVSYASAYGAASANFLNTGTFQFSNLQGASFDSGSGLFLTSSNVSNVPLPSGIYLLGSSLALLFARRARIK